MTSILDPNATVTLTVGPEQAGDTGAYRTVVDVVVGYKPTDALNLFVDALYGHEVDGRVVIDDATKTALDRYYAQYGVE